MNRLTRDQVREVDRRAIHELGIPGIVLMENAARAVADVALRRLDEVMYDGRISVLCGGGNNGGDGYAIARHLHNAGCEVEIFATTPPEKLEGDAAVQSRICGAMGFSIELLATGVDPEWFADIMIDALLGTGLSSPPRPDAAEWIEHVNTARNKHGGIYEVLSVDLPSGLDCDTGRPLGACVRADRTVTFVAEKAGFMAASAREFLGEVTIGDIGVPPELVEAVRGEIS